MKNSLWKLVLILIVELVLVSCSQQSRMKNILMELAEKECPNYKFESFEIMDSITVSDYKDSIISLDAKTITNEILIEDELKSIGELKAKQDDCRKEKRKTLSWLKATYDDLIRDYDNLIEKRQKRVDNYKIKNTENEQLKDKYTKLITSKKDGDTIVYLVTLHKYDCGGGTIKETVYFDTDLNIEKKLYENEE